MIKSIISLVRPVTEHEALDEEVNSLLALGWELRSIDVARVGLLGEYQMVALLQELAEIPEKSTQEPEESILKARQDAMRLLKEVCTEYEYCDRCPLFVACHNTAPCYWNPSKVKVE